MDFDLENLFLVFIDGQNRLFRFGPFFWPNILLSPVLVEEIRALGEQSKTFEKIFQFLDPLSG
jgi:hypothetical protein